MELCFLLFCFFNFCFLFVCSECMWKRLLEEKEVCNESTDCVENHLKKSFQCNTIGFIQLEEKEWAGKNTLLMSKKLQESLNKRELAYEKSTVSIQGCYSTICCLCLSGMASYTPCGFDRLPVMLSPWLQ